MQNQNCKGIFQYPYKTCGKEQELFQFQLGTCLTGIVECNKNNCKVSWELAKQNFRIVTCILDLALIIVKEHVKAFGHLP